MRSVLLAFVYWDPAWAWAELIAYLSHIPSLAAGASGVCDLIVPKIGPVGEFAMLTFVVRRALRAHGLASLRVLIRSGIWALGFATSDASRQSFILDREGALHDVLIDTFRDSASPRIAR